MLENLKFKLIKIVKDSDKIGLCREKTGSFSIRDERTGYVLITPVEMRREELKIEHICIVDLNGKEIEIPSGVTPSEELGIHLEVYKNKDDIRAVMHVNPVYSTIFSVVNKVIPPIVYDARFYGGYIYVAPYERAKSSALCKSVIPPLSKSEACLLERNGVVIISKNVDDIVSKGAYVEKTAEIYYKSLVLNQFNEPERMTREELELKKK